MRFSLSLNMVRPTSNTRSKLIKYPHGWILNGLIVVTMATADSEIFIRRGSVESTKGNKVVSVPRPINRMPTVKA